MKTTAQSAALAKPAYVHGKELARQVFHETMASIDVRHTLLAKLKFQDGALVAGGVSHPLSRPPRVVAFGKAANRMALVLDEILGGHIEAGVAVGPADPSKKLAHYRYFLAVIPIPPPAA